MADHGRFLQQALFGGGQLVDARGQHCLHRRRHVVTHERPRQAVLAAAAFEHRAVDQRARNLFKEEWIAGGALDHKAFDGLDARIGAEQRLQEFGKALAGERVEAQLAVIRPALPFVLVFGPATDTSNSRASWAPTTSSFNSPIESESYHGMSSNTA